MRKHLSIPMIMMMMIMNTCIHCYPMTTRLTEAIRRGADERHSNEGETRTTAVNAKVHLPFRCDRHLNPPPLANGPRRLSLVCLPRCFAAAYKVATADEAVGRTNGR